MSKRQPTEVAAELAVQDVSINSGATQDSTDIEDALAALERFVVDNDDLLQLEEHIGRFNIFDALRIVTREVKHSDFLAWLIDPNESHGQGGLFLRAILMDLFRTARANGFSCPVSPIELDGEDLRGVEIRREWKNIDLLVRCNQPPFVVAVENKIRSSEHSNQLAKYQHTVGNEFVSIPIMYVFLTIEGDEASDESKEDWVPYSYGDLHRVLQRLRNANASSIGDDVLAFLDHYLRLIRGRLMDDEQIVALCERIYKNHRQAIDLIQEHAGSSTAGILRELEASLESEPSKWHIFNRTSKRIEFVPATWASWIPPISARPQSNPKAWLRWWVVCGGKGCNLFVEIGPTTDKALRRRVIDRLTQTDATFGCRVTGKKTDRWTRLRRESVAKWPADSEPDAEQVIHDFRKQLDHLAKELAGVPDALQPIFEEWRRKPKAATPD